MGQTTRLVIFTDLDGSLLDAETYRYDAARAALEELTACQVPLVLCTSKTRAEVEPLRQELGNTDPFIVENGGGVYIPNSYFSEVPAQAIKRDHYDVIELGVPYSQLREGLRTVEDKVGVRLTGFGDMSVEDIVAKTGLTPIQASHAKQREYDEPFLLSDPSKMFEISHEAGQVGLRVLVGGRFVHIVGGSDKGPACRELIALYRRHWGDLTTAAFGESLNDLPMLKQVDHPFLVERPGGGYQEGMAFKELAFLKGVGPDGWARGVLQLLGKA